jgi:hypothetical protein
MNNFPPSYQGQEDLTEAEPEAARAPRLENPQNETYPPTTAKRERAPSEWRVSQFLPPPNVGCIYV